MRLVDVLLRQGHLSEAAVADAIVTGNRPAHLDRCDLCAERALELSATLDVVRRAAVEAADQAFPVERLTAQQSQILQRLEQLDEPTRVIAFPGPGRTEVQGQVRRRVAPAWIGVAAAAGLIIGAIGGHTSARLSGSPAAVPPQAQPTAVEPSVPVNASLLYMDEDRFTPEPLGAIDELTPRVMLASLR